MIEHGLYFASTISSTRLGLSQATTSLKAFSKRVEAPLTKCVISGRFSHSDLVCPGSEKGGNCLCFQFDCFIIIRKMLISARVCSNLFATAQSSLPAQQGYVQPTDVKCEE